MSRVGQPCIVVSHPRPAEYVRRAAIITAEYKDGTVDVSVFNPYSEGPASVREASMPPLQPMGPLPLVQHGEKGPEDYRGRWVAMMPPPPSLVVSVDASTLTDAQKKAMQTGEVVVLHTVAKPNPGNKAKR